MKNVVYHYCSPSVFKNIIENKTIRLSDIMESNDSKEIINNKEYIEELLKRKINEFCKKNHIVESNKKVVNGLIFNTFYSFLEDFYYKVYVCCFSFEGDLLSQWRGYADDAKGYAIGFDLDELKNIGKPAENDPISNNLLEFGDVIYEEKKQKTIIRVIIDELFKRLKKVYDDNGLDVPILLRPVNKIMMSLFEYSFFFKNVFFKEEKEWRLCFPARPDVDVKSIKIENGYSFSELSYFLRDGKLVSYVDLYFGKNTNIIKQIVLGPKNNSNMVKEFINKNGIHCEVIKSKGTYR